ncbi:hypothetical protein [Cyanobium sp. NIES-981]|uniref:hypothetical protein n=1 Tax=Cyanobium sp. NIES-981 TaxID=1851505 RepID=UPI0007DD6DAF|nr:hypothetical protein [Cyanobium sp. NIES-981]SBO43784.1 protein of unknown function [Cyanobium sp. NIES-981]
MKLQALLSFLILAVTAIFAALNWKAFTTPSDLSLGVTSMNLPLGVVMLVLLVVVTGLFLLFVVVLQTSALLETRRHLAELRDYRDLADQAEASRFTALQTVMLEELSKQASLTSEASSAPSPGWTSWRRTLADRATLARRQQPEWRVRPPGRPRGR